MIYKVERVNKKWKEIVWMWKDRANDLGIETILKNWECCQKVQVVEKASSKESSKKFLEV